MASRDGAMVMCEDKWASLANDHRALKMLHTLRDGGTIMEAYREAGYVGGDYRAVVKFYELACSLCAIVQPGPERTVAMRKLLEAKDAAVRAVVSPGG